jgi:hypothetical protein
MRGLTPLVGTLVGLLVGLWLLAPVALGAAVLAWRGLGWLVRTRRDRRHPERAATRARAQQGRRLAAEWPLLAQTLRLGYTDQWTRQHRFPAAAFTLDDQAVTATVAAIPAPAWPTTSGSQPTWPTPGAVSASAPSSGDRAWSGCAACSATRSWCLPEPTCPVTRRHR